MTYKNYAKLIQNIRINSKSLNSQIEEAKNAALGFILADGNCDPAKDLLNAVGRGIRYGALKTCFELAGCKITTGKDKSGKAVFKVVKSEMGFAGKANIDKLIAKYWLEHKHDDAPMADEEKAKRAFKQAIQWLAKYPELAREAGLLIAEKQNNGDMETPALTVVNA